MRPLIELTNSATNQKIYIHVDHIVSMFIDKESGYTKIYVSTNLMYVVKENIQLILDNVSVLRL